MLLKWTGVARGEIPSDLALPGAKSLGISPPFTDLAPPLKFRDFTPPPILHFRSSFFLYIIGVKNNGEKIGHFDTCTNYLWCSQWNTLISCKWYVCGTAKRYFYFCEFRRIANMNFFKNVLVLSSRLKINQLDVCKHRRLKFVKATKSITRCRFHFVAVIQKSYV